MKRNLVCFRTLHLDNPCALDTYIKIGGYEVLRKIINEETKPLDILNELKVSGLRGRGGAGFPTWFKWSFIKRDFKGQKYLLCNADEGEPGTFKDKDIMLFNPHQLIEGMIIAAYVMGITEGYIYIRGEFFEPGKVVEKAIEESKK